MRIIFVVINVIFVIQQFSSPVRSMNLDYTKTAEIYKSIYDSAAGDVCNICGFETEIKQELCDTVTDLMTPVEFMRPLTLTYPSLVEDLTPPLFRNDNYQCKPIFTHDFDEDKSVYTARVGVNVFYCKDRKIASTLEGTKQRIMHCTAGFFLSGSPDPHSLFGFCKMSSYENEAGYPFLVTDINVSAYQERNTALKASKQRELMERTIAGMRDSGSVTPPIRETMTRHGYLYPPAKRHSESTSRESSSKKSKWKPKKKRDAFSTPDQLQWSSDEDEVCPRLPKCLR